MYFALTADDKLACFAVLFNRKGAVLFAHFRETRKNFVLVFFICCPYRKRKAGLGERDGVELNFSALRAERVTRERGVQFIERAYIACAELGDEFGLFAFKQENLTYALLAVGVGVVHGRARFQLPPENLDIAEFSRIGVVNCFEHLRRKRCVFLAGDADDIVFFKVGCNGVKPFVCRRHIADDFV